MSPKDKLFYSDPFDKMIIMPMKPPAPESTQEVLNVSFSSYFYPKHTLPFGLSNVFVYPQWIVVDKSTKKKKVVIPRFRYYGNKTIKHIIIITLWLQFYY